MAYFSFSLLSESLNYATEQILPNKKYYSKDITLWKHLNNKNKTKKFCFIVKEKRLKIDFVGKKILICLPPKFGLGDAIEYSIAIKSLINSKKYEKIGIAYLANHEFVFKNLFFFCDVYPLIISDEEINTYDTIFHITLEINALKFQKYLRSNIALEICKYFDVETIEFTINNKPKQRHKNSTISIFPVSTSVIRSVPFNILGQLVNNLQYDYDIKIIIDDSSFSKKLQEQKFNKNNVKFIKPKNIRALIKEISKVNFGIFVDSGPLHIAKMFNIKGLLIETSVSENVLLKNSKSIQAVKNYYTSNYCSGPCGLVDIFSHNKTVGCYETNKISFANIKSYKNIKKLQRFNKQDNNTYFLMNPVGCVKKIGVKNITELVKAKLKEKKCEDL